MIDKQKIKQLIQNPVYGFFDEFKKNLNSDLDHVILEQLKDQDNNIDKINHLVTDINNLKNDIKQRKKDEKIKQRTFCNILIAVCFVIIIGLFFLHFYLKNSKFIKNFKKYEIEKNNQINICNSQKNKYIYNVLSQINSYKISQEILLRMVYI
ncbi:hypothetical protein [Ureaplasma parvum]|uniref:hypothetical protein n=1 Tax=Ureaplasma parvum TaxID=134821 RepID=UPI001E29D640|nr:hypothetical protein [Ureaplasma parvum]